MARRDLRLSLSRHVAVDLRMAAMERLMQVQARGGSGMMMGRHVAESCLCGPEVPCAFGDGGGGGVIRCGPGERYGEPHHCNACPSPELKGLVMGWRDNEVGLRPDIELVRSPYHIVPLDTRCRTAD